MGRATTGVTSTPQNQPESAYYATLPGAFSMSLLPTYIVTASQLKRLLPRAGMEYSCTSAHVRQSFLYVKAWSIPASGAYEQMSVLDWQTTLIWLDSYSLFPEAAKNEIDLLFSARCLLR